MNRQIHPGLATTGRNVAKGTTRKGGLHSAGGGSPIRKQRKTVYEKTRFASWYVPANGQGCPRATHQAATETTQSSSSCCGCSSSGHCKYRPSYDSNIYQQTEKHQAIIDARIKAIYDNNISLVSTRSCLLFQLFHITSSRSCRIDGHH